MMSRLYKNMCDSSSGDGEQEGWKIGQHVGGVQRWFRGLTYDKFFELLEEFDPYGETPGLEHTKDNYRWGAFMVVWPLD